MGDQRRIQTVRNVCRQVDCKRPAASSTQQQQLYGWERDNVIYIQTELPTLVVNPILCWCNNIYCHPALESHQLRWLAFNRIILKTIRRVTSATNGNVCRGVYSRHIIHCARNGDFCPAELHHISHLYAMVSSGYALYSNISRDAWCLLLYLLSTSRSNATWSPSTELMFSCQQRRAPAKVPGLSRRRPTCTSSWVQLAFWWCGTHTKRILWAGKCI